MIKFETIKEYYDTLDKDGNRLWDISRVKVAVKLGKITEEQFKEIVGEDYIA